MEILRKLAVVMFYASIPLLLALGYSILNGDDGWIPISATILIMALPAVPQVVFGLIDNALNLVRSVVEKDRPFNYARLVDIDGMKKQVQTLTMGDVLALTAMAWILVPLVSSIPFLYYGISPVDSFFESMSAWTSTGLSALTTVKLVPPSVIFFRSIAQWVGGLGIVVLILSTTKGREAISFLRAEGRNQTELSIASTVSTIFNVYVGLTVFFIVVTFALGFSLFDSVNLVFAGISNGGFYPFDSYPMTDLQKVDLALIMLAGATSVLFFRNIWQLHFERAVADEEFVMYAAVFAIAILLAVVLVNEGWFNFALSAAAAIAGGGFGLGSLAALHTYSIYILILLMLCGAMTGSTTGAIKLWRLLVIGKAIWRQVKENFHIGGVIQVVKVNNLPIPDRMILESAIFVFAYILVFLAASGAFMVGSYGTEDSMFLVATAMGNVGLSTVSIPAIGAAGKMLLIFLMYVGRIEIFPSLALVAFLTRR
jgi:trk system potassium uptake protein TrkH